MKIIFHQDQRQHNPERFLVSGVARPNPELPERVEHLLSAVSDAGHCLETPPDYGLGPLAAVHTAEYLQFLATIHQRWRELPNAAAEVVPNVHPSRYPASYPNGAVGQAGYHMADTSCPITAATWCSARASANSAIHAAQQVLDGANCVYALCRPPGHHAFRDMAGGFCYINNSAVTAQLLRQRHPRVAIVDVDLHHGNGTQGIFYHRADILTVSVHADPANFYPWFWGYAHERGAAAGLGHIDVQKNSF